MRLVNINHAYDGFLYAPLFLAYELGLFPRNVVLKYRNGDIPAIDALALKTEEANNWFAICDPFAKDISTVQAAIGKDQILIVGILINRLPVWIYNSNPRFEPVAREDDMVRHRPEIERIRCYEKYNTGFLIGERLRKKFDFGANKLEECKFGHEFDPPVNQNTLIVTSDILSIVNELDTKNIVFSYPQRCPDLNPFLFTGILTLKSVIDEHLYSVLPILAGLRTSVEMLSAGAVDADHIQMLLKKYGSLIRSAGASTKEHAVRMSIETLFKHERIYSSDFQLTDAAAAYNKAKAEWEALLSRTFPEIKRCNDPIPSLLLKKNWQEDETLIQIFAAKSSQPAVPLVRRLSVPQYICLILVLVFAFVSSYFLSEKVPPPSGKGPHLFAAAVAYFTQVGFSAYLFYEALYKRKTDQFWFLTGFIGTALATMFIFIQLM